MTQPDQTTQTNPPTVQQSPSSDPPPLQRAPVIVQPQTPDTGMVNTLQQIANTVAGLPEQIVNSLREANPQTHPQQVQQPESTQPQPHQVNPPANPSPVKVEKRPFWKKWYGVE